jgi:hypothetical protein
MIKKVTPDISKIPRPPREIYITDGFNLLDNRIYLNELIENCFSSDDHIKRLIWYITEPIPVDFIEKEKARLKKAYPPSCVKRWKNNAQFGYSCWRKRCEIAIEEIESDFIEWKYNYYDLLIKHFKQVYPNLVVGDIGKLLEMKFIERIAEGYNDGVYEDYLNKYLEGDQVTLSGKELNFENIFKKPSYYNVYKDLLYELEIVDRVTEQPLVKTNYGTRKTGKAYLISAVIVSLKKSTKKLLNRNYPYKDLLKVFNRHLNMSMKQVKPMGTRFHSIYKEIREFISDRIK